nr:hypothetical protein HmN_000648900 [Hymenolepis microstoma]
MKIENVSSKSVQVENMNNSPKNGAGMSTVKFCFTTTMPLHFPQELSESCEAEFDGKRFHILLIVQT